jgi:uncharacterized protein
MILDKLNQDIKDAMRSKNKVLLLTLRSLKADLKRIEIDTRESLTDEIILNVFQKAVKSREQAAELFKQGGRNDLLDKELAEIVVIKQYLPLPLTEEEILAELDKIFAEIKPSGMKDMGKVMKIAREIFGSRADGKILSSLIKQKLV